MTAENWVAKVPTCEEARSGKERGNFCFGFRAYRCQGKMSGLTLRRLGFSFHLRRGCIELSVQDLGLRVWGLGFRVECCYGR